PEEQWGVLLEGSGIRIQDGQEVPVGSGDFWCTPGDVAHGFRAGPDGAKVLDIFAPPREDYRKAGSGFGVS
ncbi:MAG: cupin domain-containing protein, partial [Rhodospirillaceae bacterium]